MNDLQFRIDRYIFQDQTLQILEFYVKLPPLQTKFQGFNTKFNLAADHQSLKISLLTHMLSKSSLP